MVSVSITLWLVSTTSVWLQNSLGYPPFGEKYTQSKVKLVGGLVIMGG